MNTDDQNSQSNGDIDIVYLLLLLWRQKSIPIAFVLIGFVFTFVYVKTLPSVFTASTTLQVGIEQGNIVSIDELYVLEARTEEHYNTQIELLKSRQVLKKVVEKLGLTAQELYEKPTPPIVEYLPILSDWFNKPIQSKSTSELAISIQSMLSVSQIKSSEFIKIKVTAHSAELAANIANTLADIYMEYHSTSRSEVNENASTWLIEEIEKLKNKLNSAEAGLQKYKMAHDLIDIEGVLSLKANEIETYAQQVLDYQKTLEQLKARFGRLKNTNDPLALLNANMASISSLIASTKKTLSHLQQEFANISLVYGPKHPKHQSIVEEISSVESTLQSHIDSALSSVDDSFLAVQSDLASAQKSFEKSKAEYHHLSMQQSEFHRLQREVESNQELYDTFLTRLQETKATKNLQKSFARILDYAYPPKFPSGPKKVLIMAVSIMLCACLGVLLILVLEFSRKGILNAEEAARITSLAVLSELPKVNKKLKAHKRVCTKPCDQLVKNPHYLETMRNLRTKLKVNENSCSILAVTSAMSGEGKSSTTLNLAEAFSELERVLVIDADLHKPSMADKLGLDSMQAGLVELMSGKYKLGQCLQRSTSQNYDIMCAGHLPDNPSKLLLSRNFARLLKGLSKHYDRVIVETAPINLVSDAQAISKSVDGVLFVTQAESTSREHVKNGIRLLHQVNANILGLVLNQTNDKLSKYQYHQ
ncbi:GumC family protein [Agaribacter marinus]|uniref:non-specific protein-tyrosine kinase n=1 Tax=Agaribacter marinus TaxID=1431249 RepID=A0AA37T1E4_9ALTE|nr:polysaccharide biosynthesis tyrosine autokinase [Agaribacter marinus]GLR70628.1 chain-length determining protein [Agaribacter marinus]